MRFEIHLADEDQIQLENVDATVTNENTVEFEIKGTISTLGAETLDPLTGKDVRPVAVIFETDA